MKKIGQEIGVVEVFRSPPRCCEISDKIDDGKPIGRFQTCWFSAFSAVMFPITGVSGFSKRTFCQHGKTNRFFTRNKRISKDWNTFRGKRTFQRAQKTNKS